MAFPARDFLTLLMPSRKLTGMREEPGILSVRAYTLFFIFLGFCLFSAVSPGAERLKRRHKNRNNRIEE